MAPKIVKETDPGWRYGEMVGGDRHKVKCNFCHKTYSGGIFRFKQHLAHLSGDAKGCSQVPIEVRQEIRALMEGKKVVKEKKKQYFERLTRMEPEPVEDDDDDDDDNEEERELRRALRESQRTRAQEMGGAGSSSGAAGSHPSVGSSAAPPTHSGGPGTIGPFLYRTQSQKQPKVSFFGDMKKKILNVGRATGKLFYYNRIPPSVADGPYFKSFCHTLAEAGPGVKLPSAYEISTKYLDMEVEEFQKYIQTFDTTWAESGCTVMCDGWTGQTKSHIINFMVYCKKGTVFMNSVNSTGEHKDAAYLSSLMERVIDRVGAANVVQIVTDNAASYKAAAKKVVEKHPHIFATPCAAHCIDLMLEDMYKLDLISKTIDEGKCLTSLIYNHEFLVALLHQYTNNHSLLRPGITRFATHFISLQSILKYRSELMQMFASRDFLNSNLYRDKKNTMASHVYRIICNEDFWHATNQIVYLIEPLVKVLKMVDGDEKPTMGFIYDALDRAKIAIKARCVEMEWADEWKPLWKVIDKRWNNQLHQDIHAAGYYLNPGIQYRETKSTHREIWRGTRAVIEKMVPDVESQIHIYNEMTAFKDALGSFGGQAAIFGRAKMDPAHWWHMFGEDAPTLQKVAIRVLSQTSTSSGCERNWSTFSLIHTKSRNRLSYTKLEKLVFVHYNMRLRARNLKRQDVQGHYDPINLDYIFEDDDPLAEWLVERELPCFPPEALDAMETSASSSDDSETVPATQMHEPEVEHTQFQDTHPTFNLLPETQVEEDALRRAKGKKVVGPSSLPTGAHKSKTRLERQSSQAEQHRPAAATQPPRLRRSSTQTPQRQRVDSGDQGGRKSVSSSLLGKASTLIGYRRLRKGSKSTEKHVSPTPQPQKSSSTSKTTSGSGGGRDNTSGSSTSPPSPDNGDQGQGEGAQGGGDSEYQDNVQVVDVLGGGYGRYDDSQGQGLQGHYEGSRQPSDSRPADSDFSSYSGTGSGASYPYPQTQYPYPQFPYPQQYPIADQSSMGFGHSAMGYAYPQPSYQPPYQPPYQPEAGQSSSSEYHIEDQSGRGFFDFSFSQYLGQQGHDDYNDDDDNNGYEYGRFSSFN